MYEVLASGSHGNAVIYNDNILVDCGVSRALLADKVQQIAIVLLTHEHKDHLNLSTLRAMQLERPSLRIGCGLHLSEQVKEFRNVDFYDTGLIYDYHIFKISPVKLYHDVANFGYRIFIGDYKIIHATDTAHLAGIRAQNYDLYAIEHNYDEDTIFSRIESKKANGLFSHEQGSINTHLSEQQAREWIAMNKKPESKILRLHESKNY